MARSRSGASKTTTKSKGRSASRKQKAEEPLFHKGAVVAIAGSDSDINFKLVKVISFLNFLTIHSYSKMSMKTLTKSESITSRDTRKNLSSIFSSKKMSNMKFLIETLSVMLKLGLLRKSWRRKVLQPLLSNSRDTHSIRSKSWPRTLSVMIIL